MLLNVHEQSNAVLFNLQCLGGRNYLVFVMADPKYANLPGIDTDSKDVYECGDLPEDDQDFQEKDAESTSVEIVDSKGSFDKFSGKYVSNFGKDFYAGKSGYDVGGLGLAPSGDEETVFQRFNRLKIEVNELSQSVDKIQASKSEEVNVLNMAQQVRELQAQLEGVEINDVSGDSLSARLQVEEILAKLQKQPKEAKSAAAKGQDGLYQLFLTPGQQNTQDMRLHDLERRIAKIEKTVGSESAELNLLTAHAKTGTLHGAVEAMGAKLSLLDPEQLPQVDSRLQGILTKVNEINKSHKSTGESPSDLNKKIGDLYEMMRRWEGVRGALPLLLERLRALDSLHAKASDFAATLSHLESVQARITSQLDQTNAAHLKLDGMLKENLSVVEKNFVQINKRINSLTSK